MNIVETSRCYSFAKKEKVFLNKEKARVFTKRCSIQIAAMPAKNTGAVLDVLKKLSHADFPKPIPATNVIETSLNNSNFLIHGPVVLMNTR